MSKPNHSKTSFGEGAPYCAAPDSELRAPTSLMGPLSCDTHAHICGPEAKFAYSDKRIYSPPDALAETYITLLKTLRLERCVLVQPSVYGTNNTVMLQAMGSIARAGIACRAVAVVDPSITDEELNTMHGAGVRGIRFNLVDMADPKSGPPLDEIRAICERTATRGWHTEFLIHVDDYPNLDEMLAGFPTDIVIGHCGYVRLGGPQTNNGFQAMLRLAQAGKCWIKLTGPYRISKGDLPYVEAGKFAHAALTAAPNRVLWGTDWPHVMVTKNMPNDADLCDLIYHWVSDSETRRKLLVENPARLYGF
jgi:2-pyrone-4,6-dicarboxylate lactonase